MGEYRQEAFLPKYNMCAGRTPDYQPARGLSLLCRSEVLIFAFPRPQPSPTFQIPLHSPLTLLGHLLLFRGQVSALGQGKLTFLAR